MEIIINHYKIDDIEKEVKTMEKVWNDLYNEALKVIQPRYVSRIMEAGETAAAIESKSGKIYVGVCVDATCGLGICAERNAIFNMITHGENEIKRVIAVTVGGKVVPPCGACRELMAQLMPDSYQNIEVMLDYDNNKVVLLSDLLPDWWI